MKNEDLIKTITHRGFDIDICYDTDAESPDQWGDEEVFLIYGHRDFCVKRKGFDPDEIFEVFQKKNLYNGYHIFPVYAYIHGGVSLSIKKDRYSFTDRWDVSFKGFVLVKREKGWSWTREKAFKIAEIEIKEWNQYLSGEVYGYSWEFGGCWGYYGDMEYVIQEAKSEVDSYIWNENHKRIKKHLGQLKIWIQNRVPLCARKPIEIINS